MTQIRKIASILFFFLLLQRSDAQNGPSYSLRIPLPPVATQNDALTMPNLPIYDQENLYLQVRDSSQDWYDAKLLNQEHFSPEAIYSNFAEDELQLPEETPSSNISSEFENRASILLDAEQRILSDLQDSDILLDETLMPIPR